MQHLRSSISIVNQSPSLFNDTIENNIAYGYDAIDEDKLKEAATLSGCDEFINNLPEGFKSEIGDDGVLLSGGQRQRIAIARAFYKDSPIIILDEATSALDNESELIIQDALNKLISNRTTIVIAHRLSTIEDADKILVLDEGSVAEEGSHSELLEKDGLYKSLYKNKFEDSDKKDKSTTTQTTYIQAYEQEDISTSLVVDAWYNKSFWLYLLAPFSLIYSFFVNRRRAKFLSGKYDSWKPETPIIIVGNITIGGTGKTPLVKYIANKLKDLGYKPGIVSRGYGGNYSGTLEVTSESTYKETGDEAQILAKLNMPFYLDRNRPRAVKNIVDNKDCDVIIADDAWSESSFAQTQGVTDADVLSATPELVAELEDHANNLNIDYVKTRIHSSDVFYRQNFDDYKTIRDQHGCQAVEMEAFALFANAQATNKQAACVLTVSDSLVTHEATTSDEREKAFTNMMKIALQMAD